MNKGRLAAVLMLLALDAGCEVDGDGADGGARDVGLPDFGTPDRWSYDYALPDAGPQDLAPLGPWTAEVVSPAATRLVAIALNSGGQPRVAFEDQAARKVMLAERAASWSVQEVAEGRNPSLALDSGGQPHLSLARAYGNVFAVQYAQRPGSAWSVEDVDDSSWFGEFSALAVDGTGRAHVSYFNPDTQQRWYARREGAGWSVELLDTYDPDLDDRVGEHSAIAVDSTGNPRVVWAKSEASTDYKLKQARYDGAVWHFDLVDRATYVWVYVAMDIDSLDFAHVCYFDIVNHQLRYARETAAGWSAQTVAPVGIWSTFCDIAVGGDGNARIVFNESDQGTVNFARFDGSRWTVEVVDRGRYCALELDGADRPHLVYHDADPDVLKYAVPR